MPPKASKKSAVPGSQPQQETRPDTKSFVKEKRDIPFRLLDKPSAPYRGLHYDNIEKLKPLLEEKWQDSLSLSVSEDKAGGDRYEVVDGHHRWWALSELWQEGKITGEYLVSCVVYKRETPDSVLMELAESVNAANVVFQKMTLLDKLVFIRQVLQRMEHAQVSLAHKVLPADVILRAGAAWDHSPGSIHQYLYGNSKDTQTQKVVNIFRACFGPHDRYKENILLDPLDRTATLWNQLQWLNERSAHWWAYYMNTIAKCLKTYNERVTTPSWKREKMEALDLDIELRPFNESLPDIASNRIAHYADALQQTGFLVLHSLYPGILGMTERYGKACMETYRPYFEYILFRAILVFAVTGKVVTRNQLEQFRDETEVIAENQYTRFSLFNKLQDHRRTKIDSTIAGTHWCTLWDSRLPVLAERCAWPACKRHIENKPVVGLRPCDVCSVHMPLTAVRYHACESCTKTAFSEKQPIFEAKDQYPEHKLCVCPTCFVNLQVRSNNQAVKHLWSHPGALLDTTLGVQFCIRCWAGWGTCNVHNTHRGKPFFNSHEDVVLDAGLTRDVINRVPGRHSLVHIALKLGQHSFHRASTALGEHLDALTLACLLPTKTSVHQLWRAAAFHSYTQGVSLGDLNDEGPRDALDHSPLILEVNGNDELEDPGATDRKLRKDEHTRKKKLYEASLQDTSKPKQMLSHGAWQTIHPLRNQPLYKGKIGLFFFDPMYAKAEQPTHDDFAKIRDMMQAMAAPGAVAVVFNSFLNFELWKRNLEEVPVEKNYAPWVADPNPLVIVRAGQRMRTPKPGSIVKNFCEYALIFRQSVRSNSRGTRWVRPDGGALLEQFERMVPSINPPNSNVWQNYVTPGVAESLHDDEGKRVRKLAEKSIALMWTLIARFVLLASGHGVFDFFAGTGVLGIASKMHLVPYFGMEKEAKVAALAQMRLGAVSKIIDTPEMLRACGKHECGLMTHTVPTAAPNAMMAFVSRAEEGILPTVMEPKGEKKGYTLHGTRPDGKKAVHGAICDCVYDDDGVVIRELGSDCDDFYVQPSTLTGVNGIALGEGLFTRKALLGNTEVPLFAFGKLTSKFAYETEVAKDMQYPDFPGVFSLQRAAWLLVLAGNCPAAKINAFNNTGEQQNVYFKERLLESGSLTARGLAFQYLQVVTKTDIAKNQELLNEPVGSQFQDQVARAPMELSDDKREEAQEATDDDASSVEDASGKDGQGEAEKKGKGKKIRIRLEEDEDPEHAAEDESKKTEDERKQTEDERKKKEDEKRERKERKKKKKEDAARESALEQDDDDVVLVDTRKAPPRPARRAAQDADKKRKQAALDEETLGTEELENVDVVADADSSESESLLKKRSKK